MFDLLNKFLNSGKIAKVKIKGFEDVNFVGSPKIFEAFINPDELTVSYHTNIDHTPVIGQTSTAGAYLNSTPMELALKFYIDGTNASGTLSQAENVNVKVTVAQKISEFYEACGYNPDRHKPRHVQIFWGEFPLIRSDLEVFHGCLKTVSVNYKLFDQHGAPLRAIINATFVETIPAQKRDSAGKASSPDLTHVRIVKEGDTLPGMAQKIYGDFSYYLEVAKVNGLTGFRELEPGMKIFFPPFDKKVKTT